MIKYNSVYNFSVNGIYYGAKINGTIFSKANCETEFYNVSNLKKDFLNHLIITLIWAISDDKSGTFVDNKSFLLSNVKIMQSKINDAFALLVDNNLYPFSININVVVDNPLDLLKLSLSDAQKYDYIEQQARKINNINNLTEKEKDVLL